jgi:uncharacterized protein (TIGR03437 family)
MPIVESKRMANRLLLLLAIVSLFFCSLASQAQTVSFQRSKNVPIGLGSYSVTSGDFNGDGKLDLVVSSNSNAVLLLGNGDGTFKKIDLGFVAQITLVADVNRDKKLDLLVSIDKQAYVLLGNGDGTFQPAKPLPVFPLAVADFNGDGNPDLLAANQLCSESSLSVYPGNGDGTFRDALQCSAGVQMGDWGSRSIVVGDLNGDGKLDVVWGNIRGWPEIFLWLGNGDGTFKPPSPIRAGTGAGGKPIAVGDLNHDGKPDLVVGTPGGVDVLLGNGDGTFQISPSTETTPGGGLFLQAYDGLSLHQSYFRPWTASTDIFIRDFDGDGNLDIVLDNALFRGNGDGTFQPAQFLGAGSAGAISVICEDINGDGKPDLVYLDQQSDTQIGSATMLSILLNNSPNGLPNAVLGYSAATGGSLLAPASIASVYGKTLARVTVSASAPTLPTQLGGISLRVRDDTDTIRLAQLIYVSPTQINFIVPAETSVGPVTLTIDDGSTPLPEGANATIVNNLAVGFFSANQNGQGVAAATAVRIRADGTQESVPVLNCTSTGQCSAVPIDLANGLPVYLSLYGTGFGNAYRNPAFLSGVSCQVGGKGATLQFAGPQPVYPGLDQLNLLLPQSLPSGPASVQCQFAGSQHGYQSNVVQIAIK